MLSTKTEESLMSDHEIILKMIAEVSPDDNEKLRIIDELVLKFIENIPESLFPKVYVLPRFTTSRDALKAIRPKGWFVQITSNNQTENNHYHVRLYSENHRGSPLEMSDGHIIYTKHSVNYNNGKTEELAELHAIIQAIAYERENK